MFRRAARSAFAQLPTGLRSRLRPIKIGPPHLPGAAITAISEALRTNGAYLEFGSGGSTVAFAPISSQTVSVESDLRYLTAVRRALTKPVQLRTTILYIDIGPTEKWGRPTETPSHAWDEYSLAAWRLFDRPPDVVLIDGRFRVACAIETALRCPTETIVFVDDFGERRDEYAPMLEFLEVRRMIEAVLVASPRADVDPTRAADVLSIYRRNPA